MNIPKRPRLDLVPGTRVQLHPATDAWMRGDRYGEIVKAGPRLYHVLMDTSGRTRKIHPSLIGEVIEKNPVRKGRAFQSGRKLRVKRGEFSEGYRNARLAVDLRRARRVLRKSSFRVNPPRSRTAEHFELLRDGKPITRGTYLQLAAWIHRHHSYSMDHALKHEGYSVRPLAERITQKNPARSREIVTLTGKRSGRILGYATPDTPRAELARNALMLANAHSEPVKIERVKVTTRMRTNAAPAPVRAYLSNPAPRTDDVAAAARRFSRFTGHRADKVKMIPYPSNPGAGLAVGPVLAIAYTATRDGRTQNYMHKFSPHARPQLISSHDGRQLILAGGRYKFTERGIVDARRQRN